MLASIISFYLLHINLIDRNYHWGRSYLVFLSFLFLFFFFFFNEIRPAVFFSISSFQKSAEVFGLFRICWLMRDTRGETKGKWDMFFYFIFYFILFFSGRASASFFTFGFWVHNINIRVSEVCEVPEAGGIQGDK